MCNYNKKHNIAGDTEAKTIVAEPDPVKFFIPFKLLQRSNIFYILCFFNLKNGSSNIIFKLSIINFLLILEMML